MQGDRLSALDASFLAAESATAHTHVGWVAVVLMYAAGDSRLAHTRHADQRLTPAR
jgi:hypothetical protein